MHLKGEMWHDVLKIRNSSVVLLKYGLTFKKNLVLTNYTLFIILASQDMPFYSFRKWKIFSKHKYGI